MGKCAIVFLTEILVILEIVLGSHFHGHESYKQYYNNHVNSGLKHPTTISYEMSTESYYDSNGIKEEIKPHFEDGWQARNGDDNYADVTRCDHIKQTFCEDVPNYPQEFVNRMISKNSSLLHYAYEDIIALSPRLDNEEEPLCLATARLIQPRTAVNLKDQWLYIVQNEKLYQRIRVEICRELDAKCRIIDGLIAEGYITICKQKFIYRELSAISETGEIIRDYFRLPASCCCHVEFKPEFKQKDIF